MRRIPIIAMLLLAISMPGQNAPEPRKGDTVGWHLVQEGETLSGITEKYLGDAMLWRENHRLNPGIVDPNRLTPGQRIRVILSREIAARHAEVAQVSRRVDKKPRTTDWTRAQVGDELVEREGLRTFPRSSAELGFDDGSNLILTENSIVFLREHTSSLRRVDRSLIEIVDGGVDVAVTPKAPDKRGKDFQIVIGEVTAKPKATSTETAKARATKDDSSNAAKLMVYAGASEIESAGVSVNVRKGMGTTVHQGEAPKPPERLLAAPKLLSPATGASVSGPLEVTWEPVPRATGYTLEVCRDVDCSQLVDRQVNLTSTSARASSVPSGDLFWRVTAKSASGLDGFPSKASKVSIATLVAGHVLIDRAGAMDASSWIGASEALVRLYADDGNGTPDESDSLFAEVSTDKTGRFAFEGVGDGTYWLAAKSIVPSMPDIWLEQVAGPAGALCARDDGLTVGLTEPGPCYGGRRTTVSDDFSSLGTSEHVVKVETGEEAETTVLDIVFSPAVVTTTVDAADMPQGSLRRFMSNAAALSGNDTMRFVPIAPSADGKTWWTIELTGDLPPVEDELVIDGTAWTTSGARRDDNEGRASDGNLVGSARDALVAADLPELEIRAGGASRPFVARSGVLTLSNVAVLGAKDVDVTSVARLVIENAIVGAGADLSPPDSPAAVTIEVSGEGTAELSRAFVRSSGSYGILVRSETSRASVSATDLEVVNCASGAAFHIESNGSNLERVHLSRCGDSNSRLGFELKGSRGTDNQTCRGNRISSSTISDHVTGVWIRIGAMDNAVEGTLFDRVDNGVALELVQGFWVPKGNLVSRNEWIAAEEPIALSGMQDVTGVRFFKGSVSCADGGWVVDRALDFPGTFTVTREGEAVRVSASVCPNVTVEGYQAIGGDLRFVGSVKSDSSGNASGRIELPPGATRIGLIAIDQWNTTSRMVLNEID